MAKAKTYLNILDQMLDSGIDEAEMSDAEKRGDDLSDLTRDMAEDGSFTKHIAASLEASRTHISKKLSDDNVLNDVVISENKAKSNKDGLASEINEASLMAAIDKLLKIGHSPAKIAAAIEKCAEINLDNKQMSTNYLKSRSNDLGMGYLEPNTFMPKQPDTYERTNRPKVGSAHVAVQGEELLSIGESKFGGAPSVQRPAVELSITDRVGSTKQAKVKYERRAGVPTLTAGDAAKTASVYNRGEDFDSGSVAEQHTAGKSFEQIWHEACQHAGLHKAAKAFNEYINRAKRDGVKFASADVDFLREKLGHKGVEVAPPAPRPLPRIAFDSGKQGGTAKDGNELLKEFGLTQASAVPDIEFREEGALDVEIGNSEINI